MSGELAITLLQFSKTAPLAFSQWMNQAALLAQGGSAATGETAPSGFVDILLSGGVVALVILLVLFALSIAAAYLLFDQVMTLRRSEILPEGVGEVVRQALLTGRPAEADAACRRAPSVLSVVLLSGLSELEFGWREVEKAVEDSLAQQAARLMRRIEYLSVIGNIAPMVGLLGTVTGMIFAFQQVASTRGAAGAGDLAQGIYQALVTTVGGLVVAIPSLAIYAVCRNRVDSLISEVAYQSQHALAPIKRRATSGRGRAPAATPAAHKPATQQPAAQKSNAQQPAAQKSNAQQPAAQKSNAQQPTAQKPASARSPQSAHSPQTAPGPKSPSAVTKAAQKPPATAEPPDGPPPPKPS